jgi:hypothetical protein
LFETAYTPHGDWEAMLGFLGANVGDHLRASVSNVLAETPPHFEQAVFTEGLSDESVALVRALARRHWQALMAEAVPLLEQRRALDREHDVARRRVRLGLYSFHELGGEAGNDQPTMPPAGQRAPANGED